MIRTENEYQEAVKQLREQEERLRKNSLQEEYRGFLARHGISFDENVCMGLASLVQGFDEIRGIVPRALPWAEAGQPPWGTASAEPLTFLTRGKRLAAREPASRFNHHSPRSQSASNCNSRGLSVLFSGCCTSGAKAGMPSLRSSG